MKCQHCKVNEATTHIKRNINGDVTELHLCSECAAKAGYSDLYEQEFFSPFDVFESLFGGVQHNAIGRKTVKRCESCGASFDEIAQSGKAGCPDCYKFFEAELSPTIRKIHGSAKHVGRGPASFRSEETAEEKIDALSVRMQKAVEEQNYEEAARLRDEIKALRSASNDKEGA